MAPNVHIHEMLLEAAASAPAAARALMVIAILFVLMLLPFLLRTTISTSTNKAAAIDAKLLRLLPSPTTRLPIIGHLHLMVGSLPYVSLAGLATKYGPDLMLLHLGAVPAVVVSSPRAAEAVLRTHDHVFASRPRSKVSDIIMYGATDSCFAPYGDHFRRVRKLVTVHLLNARKVRSQRLAREEEVRAALGKVGDAAASHAAVDMSGLLHSYVNDLVCRAVSGKFSMEEGRNRLFRELTDINAGLLGGFNVLDYFPSLGRIEWLSNLLCAKAIRVRQRWDQLLDRLIDEHASRMVSRGEDEEAEVVAEVEDNRDFIDVSLSLQKEYGLTRDHIKAILIDMFEAGTDTSYMTLEFAMAELIRQPHLMNKVQEEVRRNVPKGQDIVTEDDLADMTYLKAVIKETLRLHPPVPLLIPHFSLDACDVGGGHTIPANTRIVVNAWALGRHTGYWEHADEFRPERFLDGRESAAGVGLKAAEFHFMAFGFGRRMCPGVHSASATVGIMLANLVYRFDWKLPPGLKEDDVDMTEVFGITVSRKEKLLLLPQPTLLQE